MGRQRRADAAVLRYGSRQPTSHRRQPHLSHPQRAFSPYVVPPCICKIGDQLQGRKVRAAQERSRLFTGTRGRSLAPSAALTHAHVLDQDLPVGMDSDLAWVPEG
jgi:hypothetical protein